MNDKIICSKCGQENPINFTSCLNCNNRLKNSSYYEYDYKDFYELFSEENKTILEHAKLTDTAYDTIINSIIEIGSENIHKIPEIINTPTLLTILKPYVHVSYDETGNHPDYLSYYSFNNIFLNKDIPESLKNSALLHEFAHHLCNEIVKQTIMHLLNHEKNLTIESFAWYLTLQNNYLKIANEFVAHRVQEYFLPDTFGGYTSLIQLIEENKDNLDNEKIETAIIFGNSLTEDVIFIIEQFVLRQSSFPESTTSHEIFGYDIPHIKLENKLKSVYTLIFETFNYIYNNKVEMIDLLYDLDNNYIEFNYTHP